MSMAPLSYEVTTVSCQDLPHFGPVIPQINTIWFKLFLYSVTNSGPTSLLLSRGTLLVQIVQQIARFEVVMTGVIFQPQVPSSLNFRWSCKIVIDTWLPHGAMMVALYQVLMHFLL